MSTNIANNRRPRARSSRVASTLLMFGAAALATACDYKASAAPRVVTIVRIALADDTIEVGGSTKITATALDQYGDPIADLPATYASSALEVADVSPTLGVILAHAPGTTLVSGTIQGRVAQRLLTVVRSPVRVNEIQPNGDEAGGWVELYNTTLAVIDLSGWAITASDSSNGFVLPTGVSIPAGGYRVFSEQIFPLGLNAVDAVHLFNRSGVQVDSFSWLANPATSFGRCPDGTGDFVTTTASSRGFPNVCAVAEP
ncbi:MAG TPA: lamin tail domain-containing protein [Gemmatimonadaceae bacterium]|nr:lamin tail domain-containing protein [Gemmatimonadaceae bacterium]